MGESGGFVVDLVHPGHGPGVAIVLEIRCGHGIPAEEALPAVHQLRAPEPPRAQAVDGVQHEQEGEHRVDGERGDEPGSQPAAKIREEVGATDDDEHRRVQHAEHDQGIASLVIGDLDQLAPFGDELGDDPEPLEAVGWTHGIAAPFLLPLPVPVSLPVVVPSRRIHDDSEAGIIPMRHAALPAGCGVIMPPRR